MNGIGNAALEAQDAFQKLGFEFCIIGGLAVVHWGRPRSTQDVDISLLCQLGDESQVCAAILSELKPRIPDAAKFATESRMLLCEASNGIPIDIALAAFQMEHEMIERASTCELQPGVSLRLATAEDIVVMKTLAARPQDLDDVRGIVERQGTKLKDDQILRDLSVFCKLLEVDEPLRVVKEILGKRG